MKRAEQREQTREALLDAAAIEFEANGYSATALSSVAGRLGLTKGTVYFHFPTKALLAAAVAERYFELWGSLIETAQESDNAYSGLMWLSHQVAKRYRDDVNVRAAVRLFREQSIIGSDLPTAYVDWIGVVRDLLLKGRTQHVLTADFDLDNMAWQLVASFFGNQQLANDLGRQTELTAITDGMWEIYSLALLPQKANFPQS